MNILFVCLGNICRSPMAEVAFQRILEREHATDRFTIDSAGLIGFHAGENYPTAACATMPVSVDIQ